MKFLRGFKHGVKNLWNWFPIIWNDRDWDWEFLVTILEYKFNKMSDCLLKGHHINCEKDAEELKECAVLCRRLLDDNYAEEAGYNYNYDKLNSEEKRKIWKISDELQHKDLSRLSELIATRLLYWWD